MRLIHTLILLPALLSVACANATDKTVKGKGLEPQSRIIEVGGSDIEVVFNQGVHRADSDRWLEWVRQSAETVSDYYGGFPVKNVGVNLVMDSGSGVKTGRAYKGVDKPQLIVWVGTDSRDSELKNDWIMIHEMIHLATASLPRRHNWLEEGLSVYIESVSRAQKGYLTEERVWKEFFSRMPQGQPINGDNGLDNTPTWGRTYWGGAIFCLVVDVAVREHTNNEMSLKNVVRSVVKENLTMDTNATMDDILNAMDRDFDIPLVRRIYETYAHSPKPFGLEKLWRDLGVNVSGGSVTFDDAARLAYIRKAITHDS